MSGNDSARKLYPCRQQNELEEHNHSLQPSTELHDAYDMGIGGREWNRTINTGIDDVAMRCGHTDHTPTYLQERQEHHKPWRDDGRKKSRLNAHGDSGGIDICGVASTTAHIESILRGDIRERGRDEHHT